MLPKINILEAMLHCPYKAWQLAKDETSEDMCLQKSGLNPIAVSAWQIAQLQTSDGGLPRQSTKLQKQAQQLSVDTISLLSQDQSPTFFKIPHCSECQFKEGCYKKLKERDCLSLLAAITPKAMAKYHSKGITTITQLSHLFKPRRRRAPQPQNRYLWELKALAIREQKTFVIQSPVFNHSLTSIFLDFEGTAENHIYLMGGLIMQDGKAEESFSLWSDRKEDEEANFKKLLNLLDQYPGANIYHFGSYETKAIRQAAKKWPQSPKHWVAIEKQMVNLLGYLRTHVYPPTYGNGLKEIGAFLNFKWSDPEADGFLSMEWRRQWDETRSNSWKEKLIRYNQDDCRALYQVYQWFLQLAEGADADHVQQVAQMKKHTPYRLQNNLDYGEDFQKISKAAYFDYQRNKIYWRNELKKQTPAASPFSLKPKTSKGAIAWRPKTVNEVIIVSPLKKCPHCGSTKLYQSRTIKTSVKQTDLHFTASGIRQHVTEYRSGTAKCAKCRMKTGNHNLRMMHYGDNLFALVINYYVNYHISNALISDLIQEHYRIWISPMYLVMYKNKWWNRTWAPVADYVRSIVLNCSVIHIDETTIKLARESGYVWVFATTHTVFYHYASTREVSFLQDLLKDYKGIIVSDFYPGYDTLHIKSQKCLIHLIRDLNDDLFKNQFDIEYKAMVAAFSKLLRKIIETIDKHGLKKDHIDRHVKDTEIFFKEYVERDYKSELALKYTKRFNKHWEHLWTFLHHDNVPWNNNNAEAAVKAFAQHRRGVKGQMHVKGINEFLQMLTVAQTCRYRNISFLDFLRRKKGIWENVQPEALPGFLPFDQAKLFMHRLGFERKMEWNKWVSDRERPAFIPSRPELTYKNKGWIDWHDWIGFDFLPFEKARTFMRKLQLKNRDEYWAWLASGKRPKNIPYSPEKVYKYTGWVDLGDWLGTGNKGRQKKKILTYPEAKAYVQALGIKSQEEYRNWRKSGNRPETIPSSPNIVYSEFEGWGKFLGTNRIANQCKEYWSYAEAKVFLKALYIRSIQHFRQLHNLGVIPKEIPKNPYSFYKKQGSWVNFSDFLHGESLKNKSP